MEGGRRREWREGGREGVQGGREREGVNEWVLWMYEGKECVTCHLFMQQTSIQQIRAQQT